MKQQRTSAPWWKFGYVWLVIAGPVAVVVAGLATFWIAARSPDPVLAQERHRVVQIDRSTPESRALLPAIQGRNHAATSAPARQQ
jgi:uncharacterized protein